MTIDPAVAAVLFSFVLAGVCTLPAAHRALRRWRDVQRMCLSCGRKLVRGVRQCDCGL